MRVVGKVLLIAWMAGLPSWIGADDFFQVKSRIQEESLFRFASLYVLPSLSVTDAGYNSNIFYYDNDATPDWTVDAGLDITVAAILRDRLIIELREFPYYTWYRENSRFRSWNNILGINAYTYVGPFNFKYSYERPDIYARPGSEFGRRVRSRSDMHTLAVDYGDHGRFFVRAFFSHRQDAFDEPLYLDQYDLSLLLNRREQRSGLSMNKIIFTRTRLSLNYTYYQYFFEHGDRRDGSGGEISLGIDFPQMGRITGSLRAGTRAYDPQNPAFGRFIKPFGSGRVNVRLLQRLVWKLEYLIDNAFSFTGEDIYYDERSLRSGFDFYVTRFLKMGYAYSAGFLAHRTFTSGEQLRRGDFTSHSVQLAFRLFRRSALGLEYRSYRFSSDVALWSRSYEFIGGYVSHEF